ncbi:MAG: prepilin-type N-terminal cleavage/methylation domain-containing protein [Francisella sp.]
MNLPFGNKKSYISNNGFSLIEVMITVAILSILVTIAIPIYSNYTQRAYILSYITGNVPQIKIQITEDLLNGKDISQQTYNTPSAISVINGSTSGATIQLDLSKLYPNSYDSSDTIRLVGHIENSLVKWECQYNQNANNINPSAVPDTCIATNY